MSDATKMFPSFNDALDDMLRSWLENDTPECLDEFRKEYGLNHWEPIVRKIPSPAIVFFSESESGDYNSTTWWISDLIAVSFDHPQTLKKIIYENNDTRVTAAYTLEGNIIIQFIVHMNQEGGSLTTWFCGRETNSVEDEKSRKELGLLYTHELANNALPNY